ncbi:hypothetical protein [Variovorax sp. ZT5R36]
MPRVLPGKATAAALEGMQPVRHDAPRRVRNTVVDFTSLCLPEDVRLALAEAFWSHVGIQSERCIHTHWFHIKTFDRFACESGSPAGLADLHRDLLVRYIEWLNAQRRPDGQPWAKSSRAGAYTALRKLLQWLERCRPGVIHSIEYPFNPFPWRNRDTPPRSKMPAHELRAILRACEADIAQMRNAREAATAQRVADSGKPGTLGWLLQHVDRHCGGIIPTARELSRAGQHAVNRTLSRLGGLKQVEPCLYPRAESLLPYYLAILIHAAGNPDPIAELERDCLQSLPLLDDRQALVWFKARANSIQRRTFSSVDCFEPPALVKEIVAWNERLRTLAPVALRERLFLYAGMRGVTALSSSAVKSMLKAFCGRHGLSRFSLASIRPGVLASFYRASGDLRRVSAVANHAHLATTVRYVQTPEVDAQHRARIAALQRAFIGHIEQARSSGTAKPAASNGSGSIVPPGEVVSMFGFGCTDPFAGAAPGTHRGELCTHFMGCFTCPNAIITPDPSTVARLLQARDHLRAAARALHPARWQSVYAPQLRILEEDILARFAAGELAAAAPLVAQLPPLPDLR